MRSKTVVPVGQGCKKLTHQVTLVGNSHNGRCTCHLDLWINRCMGCGDLFHSEMPHTKTCSDKCRKRLSRMRHDKMFQTVMAFANGE